ncbi:helix-turn-helix domain-containing protein [Nocardioides aquiterrae]|uniref:HTH tetR-type domain-containing protein n=1 Tax=Nocardioides aquiterrae TaxID=203799 RepID=A0ABN1UQD7_9ACTN
MGAKSMDTRTRLLRVGALAFLEAPGLDPLRGMTLSDIAERAGVSRSTAYRHFDSKEAYLADVSRFLVGDAALFDTESAHVTRASNQARELPLLDGLLHVATADIEALSLTDVWAAMEAFVVGFLRMRTDLHDVAVDGYVEVDRLTYSWYAPVLHAAGRLPRRPLTTEDVGVLMQALVEGAGIRETVQAMVFQRPIGTSGPAGLYAYGVAALLAAVTRTEDDDRNLHQYLEDVFSS